MNRRTKITSINICLALLLGYAGAAMAQPNPIIAVDVALEPDATMVHQAEAVNARLRAVFPKGFALDAAHHPHITMLQRFVRTAERAWLWPDADPRGHHRRMPALNHERSVAHTLLFRSFSLMGEGRG